MTVAISNLSATWSNTANIYNAIGMNVSNTGANNRSSLLSLSINGNNVFRISVDGKLRLGAANNFNVANPSVSGGPYAERVFNIVDRGPTLKIAAIDSDTGIELVRYNTAVNAVTTFMAVYGVANSLIIQDRTAGPAYTLMNVTNTLITFSRDTNISGNVNATTINAATYLVNGTGIIEALTPNANVQVFSTVANTIWNKPTGPYKMVMVQVWGAGGAGAKDTSGVAGGGGGGSYAEALLRIDLVGSTGWANVGAGGNSQTNDGQNGADGQPSSFTSNNFTLRGYGGAGGTLVGGGAGGGIFQNATSNVGVTGGAAGTTASDARNTFPDHPWGGGSGSGGSSGSTAQYGGPALWGGAGGSGGSDTGTVFIGGISQFGGNGGRGNVASGLGEAGFQPGGGGGGTEDGTSGRGGNGMIIITTF